MTNEELKKKIVEIIINAIWKDAEADYDSTDETEACSIADALVAEGIGDVKDRKFEADHYWRMWQGSLVELERAEHRAEVAEQALLTACVNLIKDEEDNVNMELLARVVYTHYLRKAEKELAEEGK